MASFFVSSTRSVHFFVHLFNIINLDYGRPKHTRNARNSSKTKTSTSRTSKTQAYDPLGVFHSDFFRHYATFFELLWIPPKGLPFVCFNILQHNGCQKIPKGPFHIFRHCDTVQKSHFKFFSGKFLKFPQGSPFNFFSYFATNWSFTKHKGSPFTILSLRF